jgi:prepilin-type N-terminal cleavage/methylation domain-containing protein
MPAKFPPQSCAVKRRGFTIIELLVAVSITVVMVGLMLTVVTNVLTLWNRTSGDLSAENQARHALDLLARDLQGAVIRTDGNVWLAATVQATSGAAGMTGESWTAGGGTLKPTGAESLRLGPALVPAVNDDGAGFEAARFGQGGMWLRLFTVESAAGQPSAPRAVSYQLARRAVGDGYNYQLFRSSVSPENTFNTGYDLFMAPATTSYNTGSAAAARGVGTIRRPRADFLLANDVIDFGVRFFATDGTVLFPSRASDIGLAATSDQTKLPPEGGVPEYGFPGIADVFLRILTPEGARQIRALEAGDIAGNWWEIALANSQVYTRRVMIASRPL